MKAVDGRGYAVRTAETSLEIQGMTCASCVSRVERSLMEVDGVLSANVNLATGRAVVHHLAETMKSDWQERAPSASTELPREPLHA